MWYCGMDFFFTVAALQIPHMAGIRHFRVTAEWIGFQLREMESSQLPQTLSCVSSMGPAVAYDTKKLFDSAFVVFPGTVMAHLQPQTLVLSTDEVCPTAEMRGTLSF